MHVRSIAAVAALLAAPLVCAPDSAFANGLEAAATLSRCTRTIPSSLAVFADLMSTGSLEARIATIETAETLPEALGMVRVLPELPLVMESGTRYPLAVIGETLDSGVPRAVYGNRGYEAGPWLHRGNNHWVLGQVDDNGIVQLSYQRDAKYVRATTGVTFENRSSVMRRRLTPTGHGFWGFVWTDQTFAQEVGFYDGARMARGVREFFEKNPLPSTP